MSRLALIGCGAIAESFYLPAIVKKGKLIRDVILVDRDESRLKKLSALYDVSGCAKDFHEVVTEVDGAIVALPHQLHYETSVAFLKAGVAVLCEKPLTETTLQAKDMIVAAKQSGVALLVNNTRRLFPNTQKVKEIIDSGIIGPLQSIQYEEGGEFTWPTTSGFYFDVKKGKGVLLDRGAHNLDLVCWWLGEKPKLVSYQDDSFGGPEAVADVTLKVHQCTVNVRMSWLTKLSNQYIIQGERGTINGSVFDWRSLSLIEPSGKRKVIKIKTKVNHFSDFGRALLDNFLDLIVGTGQPLISATAVIDSIRLIEECYLNRTRFYLPWLSR